MANTKKPKTIEEKRAYNKKWWAEHKEKKKEYDRHYRSDPKHKEVKAAAERRRYHENLAESREKNRIKAKKYVATKYLSVRKWHIRKKFGISLDEFNRMLTEQDGKCAGCGIQHQDRILTLNIDHDHITGQVRGLLCGPCNRAIGLLKDNIDTLRCLANYLQDCTKETNLTKENKDG